MSTYPYLLFTTKTNSLIKCNFYQKLQSMNQLNVDLDGDLFLGIHVFKDFLKRSSREIIELDFC